MRIIPMILAMALSTGAFAEEAKVALPYPAMVSRHLLQFKRFPQDEAAKGKAGLVHVAFTIDRSGNVTQLKVVRSSCIAAFDAEAEAMVKRAGQFPPIPDSIAASSLSFTQPIKFGTAEAVAALDGAAPCAAEVKP